MSRFVNRNFRSQEFEPERLGMMYINSQHKLTKLSLLNERERKIFAGGRGLKESMSTKPALLETTKESFVLKKKINTFMMLWERINATAITQMNQRNIPNTPKSTKQQELIYFSVITLNVSAFNPLVKGR